MPSTRSLSALLFLLAACRETDYWEPPPPLPPPVAVEPRFAVAGDVVHAQARPEGGVQAALVDGEGLWARAIAQSGAQLSAELLREVPLTADDRTSLVRFDGKGGLAYLDSDRLEVVGQPGGEMLFPAGSELRLLGMSPTGGLHKDVVLSRKVGPDSPLAELVQVHFDADGSVTLRESGRLGVFGEAYVTINGDVAVRVGNPEVEASLAIAIFDAQLQPVREIDIDADADVLSELIGFDGDVYLLDQHIAAGSQSIRRIKPDGVVEEIETARTILLAEASAGVVSVVEIRDHGFWLTNLHFKRPEKVTVDQFLGDDDVVSPDKLIALADDHCAIIGARGETKGLFVYKLPDRPRPPEEH